MSDPWGSAIQGFGTGLRWQQHKAQLDAEEGIRKARLQIEQDRMALLQEKDDWERARVDAKEAAISKLIGSVKKPTGSAITRQVKGGKKVDDPMAELKRIHESEQALARLDPGRYLERTLQPTPEELMGLQQKKADVDYKNQLIEQSKAAVANLRASAQKSVNAYGFNADDAAKVLAAYYKYLDDFEKTQSQDILGSLRGDSKKEPVSLEEYIQQVQGVEGMLSGKSNPAGIKKSQPTIAPEDEELFR